MLCVNSSCSYLPKQNGLAVVFHYSWATCSLMFSGHFGNTGPVDHPYIICVTLPREIHFFLYGAWLKPYINIKLWNSCLRFWRGAKNIKDSPEWQILKILTCTAFVSYVKLDTLLYKCPETRHPIWYVLKLINVHSLKLYHLFIWNVSEICSRVCCAS